MIEALEHIQGGIYTTREELEIELGKKIKENEPMYKQHY